MNSDGNFRSRTRDDMGPKWARIGANMSKLVARSFLREKSFALGCGLNDQKIEKNKHHMKNG